MIITTNRSSILESSRVVWYTNAASRWILLMLELSMILSWQYRSELQIERNTGTVVAYVMAL